ncbi:MAG: PepSY-associated TM helix domain-containing protein [Bacteroidales bacterium]|nr:PepSY-associated TM helix domain-containing protein [Bacteroidales bacterium]MDY0285450.1 PepSY-associated TM helix domain-containing protein [Bacteroidales bacterium]
MNFRKIVRITHRDLGYFFFAMTLIYALSGIGMNHLESWDPKYIISTEEAQTNRAMKGKETKEETVLQIMADLGLEKVYKKYYFPNETQLKIFIKNGNITVDMPTGEIRIETIRRRPIFGEFTYLHYDPIKYWTWFSDAFAVGLILLAGTGLFMVKGKHGITRRGAIWTLAGILIPLLYLFLLL